jgi:hypothetical protein
MKLFKRTEIRKLLEESLLREKGKKTIRENLKRQQAWYNSTLNESLLKGSADAMGDFIMISDSGKVIRSPNTVKGVAKATSKAIFTGDTIPKGCRGLYRVIGVEGGEAIVARVSTKTGAVLTKTGFKETLRVPADAITRSSVLYMNGLRGTEYKLMTDTGKVVTKNSKGAPTAIATTAKSPAAQKAIEKADKLLPVKQIISQSAPESSLAVHTNAAKAIAPPPAAQVAATEKLSTALSTSTQGVPNKGIQKLTSVAASAAAQTPEDYIASLTTAYGRSIFEEGASKLANSPGLEKAMMEVITEELSKQGFKDVSEETIKKMAQAQAAAMSDDALTQLGRRLGVKASSAAQSSASSTGKAAASKDPGRSTVKAVQRTLQDPKYYKQISEELVDSTLSSSMTTASGRVIPKGAVIEAILPDGSLVFKAGIPSGFKGLTVTASTTQQLITVPGPVRTAFSNVIKAKEAAVQAAKTGSAASAETGLVKASAASAETGLVKTGAEASGKTAIQQASGKGGELVVKDFAEGAIEKGAQIAKGAPQVETALTQQFVKAGSGEISEEVAKQGAHGFLGSISSEQAAEVIAKNAGQESTEVAISASGKFVTGLAKALGPAIVLAFGFHELYNAFTNDEYNDEQFYNALAMAAGNMTIGFGTLAMAPPAIAAGSLTITLGIIFFHLVVGQLEMFQISMFHQHLYFLF